MRLKLGFVHESLPMLWGGKKIESFKSSSDILIILHTVYSYLHVVILTYRVFYSVLISKIYRQRVNNILHTHFIFSLSICPAVTLSLAHAHALSLMLQIYSESDRSLMFKINGPNPACLL